MWRTLLLTMAVSAVASGLAIGYRRYEFWRAWSPTRFWIGFASYLAANAVVGALAVALADLLRWNPFGERWLLNAVTFAATGQALLRVEPRGFSIDRLNTGRSVLARAVDFIVDMLNTEAERQVQRRLDGFGDGQLMALALYLHARYVQGDITVPRETRDLLMSELVEAGDKIPARASQPEGRGTLERFCLRQLVDRELHPDAAKAELSTTRAAAVD